MLVAKARTKYIRLSPRKARVVIDLIRGENTNRALAILANINKKAKIVVEKTLKSAISNAQQNSAIDADGLFISKITADKGPTLKRFRAAAMGRATTIRHRSVHLSVELSTVTKKQIKKGPQQKATRSSAKPASFRSKLSKGIMQSRGVRPGPKKHKKITKKLKPKAT